MDSCRDTLLVLRKNARTVRAITIWARRSTGAPPEADHLYTETMIHEALQDMDIIELRCYDEQVDEGKAHAGMSALIGAMARKR